MEKNLNNYTKNEKEIEGENRRFGGIRVHLRKKKMTQKEATDFVFGQGNTLSETTFYC